LPQHRHNGKQALFKESTQREWQDLDWRIIAVSIKKGSDRKTGNGEIGKADPLVSWPPVQ
jgi:hypothetical protein